jgi:hypothetical protein
MNSSRAASATRIGTEAERAEALEVLRAIYCEEKGWVSDETGQLPRTDLEDDAVDWFLARCGGRAVGVLRVVYDPPLHLYREYGLVPLPGAPDIEQFVASHRIAEIGRFAVVEQERRNTLVALALIRAAIERTVRRGYSHYVTDVFENERHSPYEFHTRVLGFEPVATHDRGELACSERRITLLLDIGASYRRLRAERNYFYRLVTQGWAADLHLALSGTTGDSPYSSLASPGPATRKATSTPF